MGAEGIVNNDLRFSPVDLAEDFYFILLVHKPFTQRMLRLVPDDENRIPRVFNVIGQMMQDAARLAHPGCRNNHAGAFQLVKLYRLLYGPDVTELAETEGVAIRLDHLIGVVVEAFRCTAVTFTARGLSTKIGMRANLPASAS